MRRWLWIRWIMIRRALTRRLWGESPHLLRVGIPGLPNPWAPFYWFLVGLIFVGLRLSSRWEIVEKENLPPQGGWMFASNHVSGADPLFIAAVLYPRCIRYMAKVELFQKPIWGYLFALSGAFPVRRFESDLGALREAQALLEQGAIVGMFPEGHRSENAALIEAHPGTALLALRAQALIVPIAITGSEGYRRGWRIVLDRPRVRVVFGRPFRLERPARIDRAAVEAGNLRIMREIAEQLPARYRGVYRDRFGDLPPEAAADRLGAPGNHSA